MYLQFYINATSVVSLVVHYLKKESFFSCLIRVGTASLIYFKILCSYCPWVPCLILGSHGQDIY
jgi:hypothetical protein